MIDTLPTFVLHSRKNLKDLPYTGMDSPSNAIDKVHFSSFPYKVAYSYNSRGFRDAEWPKTIEELKDAIWCIGDSFTAGVGSPYEHMWTQLLQKRTGQRTINVSLDGASNDWIARHIIDLINEIEPKTVVVCWSKFHRRESLDSSLSDEERRLHFETLDPFTNVKNFVYNYSRSNQQTTTKIINMAIPDCCIINEFSCAGFKDPRCELDEIWDTIKGPNWPSRYTGSENLPDSILNELNAGEFTLRLDILKYLVDSNVTFINYKLLDLARDGFHFDRLTSESIVDSVVAELNSLSA